MANMRPKRLKEMVSVGVTPMQYEAILNAARKRRWQQSSFNRYAIIKELIEMQVYDPTQDPDNNEDFDDLILK